MGDVRRATALKGGATADEATLALQAAKGAYEKRVKPLIVEIDKLAKKAEDAEKKFKAAKSVPKSSAEHAAKVETAAKLLSAQVKAVNGEFAAFEKVATASTVEDAIGAAWFERLARVTFYRNSDVVQWTKTLGLAVSADDGLMDSEVQDTLADAAKELEVFKAAVAKLQAARDKRFERRAAIKNVAKIWQEASDFVPGDEARHHGPAPRGGRPTEPAGRLQGKVPGLGEEPSRTRWPCTRRSNASSSMPSPTSTGSTSISTRFCAQPSGRRRSPQWRLPAGSF